ncbi:MAG: aminoacetone oxidase family FAD-binding enzyme [Clostridia bacterium]|nr:aminoacetone oxidase family FAD-binding enzyme [Clostridia bacterium]
MSTKLKIAVIGGGAAGMTAASEAAFWGADVTLFEKNPRPGRKLAITGKGRCNVTNDCSPDDFLKSVPTNPRFLYSAINSFTPEDTKNLFEYLDTPLKTERGNRVFPVSDNAHDVVNALIRRMRDAGVTVRNEAVSALLVSEDTEKRRITGVRTASGQYAFDRVIVCTGGLSYPGTGSTGDGFRFARQLGLQVTPLHPSLVPIVCSDSFCAEMMGLSLRNTRLTVTHGDSPKVLYEDFGEMLFTHFGVSGPMILSASAHLDRTKIDGYILHLDLKPALDEKTLDARILSEFSAAKNRNFSNVIGTLVPQKMIAPVTRMAGISPEEKCNSITREMRRALLCALKDFRVHTKCFRPIDEAIVTSGGIAVGELSPKTMESKKISGLYFAGEVIDVDAYTGGFNLQIAFSTAMAAAHAAAEPDDTTNTQT